MKNVSARATFTDKAAEKLFGTREAARETAKRILDSHSSKSGGFTVRGYVLRTERATVKTK